MLRSNLPVYAIVELLMILSNVDQSIGNYKDHSIKEDDVKVKTTGGILHFPKNIIMQQFENPELISNDDLKYLLGSFKPVRC